MGRYSFTLESQAGLGSSDLLDRVAGLLDDRDVLIAPAITLDADTGAMSFTFEVEAPGAAEASRLATVELADVVRIAKGVEVVDVTAELDVELPVARLELEAVA